MSLRSRNRCPLAEIGAASSFGPNSGVRRLGPTRPFAVSEPVRIPIKGRPPAVLPDGSGQLTDGDRYGTAGGNAVGSLSRRGASVQAVTAGAAGGPAGGIMAIVDALFERDAFAGLTTAGRARRQ